MNEFDQEVVVRRTRWASEETGWAVVDARDEDGEPVVLVGPLVHLEEHERARVIGKWVDDSRYGLQVKVSEARPLPPSDAETLAVYLCRVKHVGAKRAQRLIERYGSERVLDAIDRDPEEAFAAVGLRRARAQEAAHSWHELRVTRRLHLLLAPHGLAYLVKRIHTEYGPTAHRVVVEHPYELTSVFGVGFLVADKIARGVGGPATPRLGPRPVHCTCSPKRSAAAAHACRETHLARRCRNCSARPSPDGLLEHLLAAGELVREADLDLPARDGGARTGACRAGTRTRRLPSRWTPARARRALLSAAAKGRSSPLSSSPASRNALTHRLSLITGGPGTGKTASIRTIAAVATAQGARVMLVAPTGRAAIRMSEASGVSARTVHSALGWIPGEGPTHDEEDPLATDLLIVDESSMANLELMVTLLRAVGARTHVVLVGDADQLAPVGAGKPFAELVASASYRPRG